MLKARKIIADFWAGEEGATAIEYALLAALVSVAAIWAMRNTGLQLEGVFRTIARELRKAGVA